MRKLFFYTKQQFFNFKAMQTAAGFKLLSMSQLLSSQKVGELNKNQKYYVDLSSVMGYTKTNDSQQMLFEQLFDSFGENIDFICDKMYEEDIKYIFRYIFDDFSDVDAASEEIIAEKETIIETPSRKRRIVDLNDKELDDFFKVFDASLYGHERFKEEFKKLVTAYRVFNKIGEHKILSLFLMGDSGVGKTEVARAIHKALGSRTKLAKVNFGNYSSHDALNSLIGSPLGYIGSDGGELLKRIQESDVGLILIDEFEKADNYIKGMDRLISDFVLFPYSNNTVLNLILNEKRIFAEQHGILYKCTVEQTDFRFMDDIDITTIFSNLLENALSASALCKTNKEVSVIVSSHNNFVIINVKNSCNSYTKCGTFSSKDYGTGLYNVENSVKKYEGFLKISYSQTEFNCNVVLSNTH